MIDQHTEAILTAEPEDCLDTEQVLPAEREQALKEGNARSSLLVYGLLGLLFGVALVQSQVVSWFRIQEMFRFDSIHMYGIIGSAVVVAALGVGLIKRMNLKTLHGEHIVIPPKEWGGGTRYWADVCSPGQRRFRHHRGPRERSRRDVALRRASPAPAALTILRIAQFAPP